MKSQFVKSEYTKGIFLTLMAGVGFGFLGVFGKISFKYQAGVGDLLIFRFVFASILLAIFNRYQFLKNKKPALNGTQKRNSFLLGVFGYAVFSSLYFFSIKYLSVALAALLLFSFPIFVNIGSVLFFKTKFHKPQIFSLISSMLGLTVLLWGDFQIQAWVGVLFGFAAAVTYSCYVLISGKIQKNVDALMATQWVLLGAGTGLFFIHSFVFKDSIHYDYWLKFQPPFYWTVLGMSILSTVIPIAFFILALQRLPSAVASVVVTVEPLVATIAAWIFLGEELNFRTFLGGSLIVLSVIISALFKNSQELASTKNVQ